MSHKQMPRLGSAIASTILSVFSAVSLVGVDKAQAAVLTYNLDVGGQANGYVKVDNSLVTGRGFEDITVSEGKLYGFTLPGKEYNNLALVATARFYQGVFRGLSARVSDSATGELIIPPDEPGGPLSIQWYRNIDWLISTYTTGFSTWESMLDGSYEEYTTRDGRTSLTARDYYRDISISYTLVDTEAESVPEPLTAGTAAVALAGLSWLKYKKKMAG